MEAALVRSSHGGVVKEEKGVESSGDEEIVAKVGNGRKEDEDDHLKPSSAEQKDLSCSNELVAFITNTRRSMEEPNLKASSSTSEDQDNQLKSTKAQMGEVREENQRLRMYLDRIMKDYQTLQKQFYDSVQQEAKKSTERTTSCNQGREDKAELVFLSLGRTTNSSEQKKNDIEQNKTSSKGKEEYEQFKQGLSLRRHSKFKVSKTGPSEHLLNPSPENSLEEARETWPPSKILKTIRSEDDEVSLQNPAKKARVSVRARCDTATMNDGCQWRKYGQKISKGNPCPRAYYRCTVVPTCPVRKQVQRCANDMSILITTYEGTHNHPLPISATAMASTTSAAASMLMSGSSTSQPGRSPFVSTTTTAAGLHGLNFYQSDNSKSIQFYLPNSSISSSPSNPIITIDLTSTSSSSSSHFNTLSSTNYPPTPIFSSESNIVPVSLGNGFLSYGTQSPYNKNNINIGTLNLGRQTQESFYQSYMQKNSVSTSQQSLPDTSNIAAATKAITSNPSFQSALMAALTSIIGGAGGVGHGNQSREENYGQKLKWGEHFPAVSSYNVQDITQ